MKFQLVTSFFVLASSFTNSLVFAAPLEERAGLTVPYFSGFNLGAGTPEGGCKTTADFEDDFQRIKSWSTNEKDKFDTVKLFEAANCDTLANAVPAALKTDTKIWAGIWLSGGAKFEIEKYALEAVLKQYDRKWLKGISVGSEELYRKAIDPNLLAKYIWDVKDMVQTTYNLSNVPVGSADTWTSWENATNAIVIKACDVILMNTFPYWQGVPAENGLETLKQTIQTTTNAIARAGPPKPLVIGETGWSSAGSKFGSAIACPACAQKYYTDAACWLQKDGRYGWYWFSAFDEPGKPGEVEKHWGVATTQKTPKINFRC